MAFMISEELRVYPRTSPVSGLFKSLHQLTKSRSFPTPSAFASWRSHISARSASVAFTSRSERETVVKRRRVLSTLFVICLLLSIPLGLWALHTFYLPLDLLLERAMETLGL